ncbi:MAG TPA: TonB-dependent receptor [Caulobacteraceae bacterium]|jgi:iron complex outermembrane receptor protein
MSRLSESLKRNLIVTTCLTAAALGAPLIAHADDATAPIATSAAADTTAAATVGQITVTAERREVNLQAAPEAISAVNSRQLDQSFVVKAADLNGTIPSLEITKASGFENLVTIRGVGSETPENSLTTTPGVSEFIDGVYIANTISLDQTLFDIADVEVLRGPQGALYGESSIGGAIILNTRQPVLHTVDGSADFSAGTYSLFRERAEVNVPVGDDVAVRLSAQKFDHTGFTKDALIPGFTLDDAHDVSGKAAILWRPNDHFSATLTAQAYYADQHGDAQKNINDPSPDPRVVFQDYPAHFQLNNQLYHLNLEWDQPGYVVKSVTGFQYLAHVQQEDSSRSAFSLIGEYDDVAAWNTWVYNFTEELDVMSPSSSRIQWDVGGFYMNQKSRQFVAEFECTTNPFSGPCAAPTPAAVTVQPNIEQSPPANLAYGNDSHAVHWTYALFGQATVPVTDRLRVTGGVRYNYDFDEDPSFNFSGFGKSFADNKTSTSEPTWRVEGDFDVTADNMVYGSVARGYKPGGANGSNGQFLIPATFQAETNTAFEVGSKNLFFDHTLRLNASLFYYIHDNFQYIETDPIPFDSGISNIPRVDDYGAEFEANYSGFDGRLHLDASLALERGRVVSDYRTIDSTIANQLEGVNFSGSNEVDFTTFAPTGPCAFFADFLPKSDPAGAACFQQVANSAVNVKGNQPPDMPQVSGSVALSYRFDTPVGAFTPRAQVIYRGSEWARIFDDPGLDKVPAYTIVNLNLDYVPTGYDHLRLSLTATNVGNVAGITSRYTDPFGTFMTSDQYIPPLQVMGTIAWRY